MLAWVVAFCEAINKVSAKIQSNESNFISKKFNA
jgi:hypothetical protein